MKEILIAVLLAALVACHEAPVRCDGHLVPINPVAKAASTAATKAQAPASVSGDRAR